MKLKFEYAGVRYSTDTILEFTKAGLSPFWSEPLFHFYPDMVKEHFMRLDDTGRKEYLSEYFTEYESKNRELLAEKLIGYNSYWQKYEAQIVSALEDAFSLDLTDLFNDLRCMTTFCPISPRYLDRHTFDNFYMESEKGALGTAIHEIIHFVWFHVWQNKFHDDPIEYETPHLKWILSEMAVEPIMRDHRLGSINPYYQHKACVYPYFYTMKISGAAVLDVLYNMISAMPIGDAMDAAYRYCAEHEQEICRHIEHCETP